MYMSGFGNAPPSYSYGSVPNYSSQSKLRPSSAVQNSKLNAAGNKTGTVSADLPKCTYKDLLNHIIDSKMYRETDLKVLYVRMCHHYGEDKVDEIWEPLMDEL